jgi:hypothetical protein
MAAADAKSHIKSIKNNSLKSFFDLWRFASEHQIVEVPCASCLVRTLYSVLVGERSGERASWQLSLRFTERLPGKMMM